jgi:hypothetical protein
VFAFNVGLRKPQRGSTPVIGKKTGEAKFSILVSQKYIGMPLTTIFVDDYDF